MRRRLMHRLLMQTEPLYKMFHDEIEGAELQRIKDLTHFLLYEVTAEDILTEWITDNLIHDIDIYSKLACLYAPFYLDLRCR